MSEPFVPGIGAVFSADIAVPEHEREVRFYSRVLSTGEQPLRREEDLMNHLGMPIIGLGARTNGGLPPVWTIYLPVGDLSESLRRVREEGGEVVRAVQGAEGEYAYAVVRDPVGAHLALVPG